MGFEILLPLLILAAITFVVVIMCMVLLIDLKLRTIVKKFDKIIDYIDLKQGKSDSTRED